MSDASTARLRIGDWRLDAGRGRLERGGESVRLEARTLRLLLELAARPGEAVSQDELLERVWAGVIVTPDSVYQAVAQLRRLMGDDPKRPRYVATVPRLGYRLVAEVAPWTEAPASPASVRRSPAWAAAAAVVLVGVGALALWPRETPATVGVLPFLDLTPGMDALPLADDVSEGIVDQLSRNPRLRAPGFRESFLLRGKHASLKDAARALGVAYAVEGSIRQVGSRVRVDARLVRADTGFIMWSQTYDRPITQVPAIDADIAAHVSAALGR
jgi:DNA-binding winged helix-turn-helix (wHTH) protein/TolB-like protein